MMSRFKELEKREQSALIASGIVVILFVIYQFILHPFNDSIARMKKDIAFQTTLHNWMLEAKTKLTSQTTQHHIADDNLLSETTKSLKKAKLDSYSYDLQQADSANVRLIFNQVPYIRYVQWMQTFWRQNALSLQSATIKPTKTPGAVKVTMTFSVK